MVKSGACLIFVVIGILFFLQKLNAFKVDSINKILDSTTISRKHVQSIKTKAVEKALIIGSFNVQNLVKKKFANEWVMRHLEDVIHRYDLILITELQTNDMMIIGRFLSTLNDFAPEGATYNFTMHNNMVGNEYCGIFYRIDKLRVLKTETYEHSMLYRVPYFVLFQAYTLRDIKEFGVIGYHVKPDRAVQEINELARVYDFMKNKHKLEDIMLMGDFNADCAYVKEHDWGNISLWTRPEFIWAIGHGVHTTNNYRSCALDRFVYAGEKLNQGVILTSARSVDLQQEYGLTLEEARALSDHRPIEIKIRGKLSATSERYLTSETCFTVKDSRMCNVTKSEAVKAGEVAHYTIQISQSGAISLQNKTRDEEDMVGALNSLRSALPLTFTREQFEATLYKLDEGALEDRSSYADEQNVLFKINYSISSSQSEIMICKTSTIN